MSNSQAVAPAAPPKGDIRPVQDQFGRALRDLRISVTDRCNFRCRYCMPRRIFGSEYPFLQPGEVLTFEEIARIAKIFVRAGVTKLRITGGEPLLRPRLPELLQTLAAIGGVEDIALTTNGSMLEKQAPLLRAAGLHRLTVSLDALDGAIFRAMSDTNVPVETVLAGIEAAAAAGFAPIKINMVVKRGWNEPQILPLALNFSRPGFVVRFIEYMDVGNTNGWRLADVVPSAEILETLQQHAPLERLPAKSPCETARRYRFQGGEGELGIIASVTQPFCQNCTRARISADGQLHTCLFGEAGLDLKSRLRDGSSDEALFELIESVWSDRSDRYSEMRASVSQKRSKTEMSILGG
jgi:cyclic pyranopterin phosphate synthase